jgi:hypothetical protein
LKEDERMALANVVAAISPEDRSLLLVAVYDENGVPLNELGKDNFSVLLWASDIPEPTITVPVTSADPVWPPGVFDAFYTVKLGEVDYSTGEKGASVPVEMLSPTVYAVSVHEKPLVEGRTVEHLGAAIATL